MDDGAVLPERTEEQHRDDAGRRTRRSWALPGLAYVVNLRGQRYAYAVSLSRAGGRMTPQRARLTPERRGRCPSGRPPLRASQPRLHGWPRAAAAPGAVLSESDASGPLVCAAVAARLDDRACGLLHATDPAGHSRPPKRKPRPRPEPGLPRRPRRSTARRASAHSRLDNGCRSCRPDNEVAGCGRGAGRPHAGGRRRLGLHGDERAIRPESRLPIVANDRGLYGPCRHQTISGLGAPTEATSTYQVDQKLKFTVNAQG